MLFFVSHANFIIGQKYRVLKKYIEIKKPEEKTREIALHSRQQ
jgi:hypothetical protein